MRKPACAALLLCTAACGGSAFSSSAQSADALTAPAATIVLMHGMGGTRRIADVDYFYGVPELYESLGAHVVYPHASLFNTVEFRAAEWKTQLDKVPGPLILLAHSQGGLDARYLVSRLGYGDRVKAVVTIATPHHGSQIADVVSGLVPNPVRVTVDELLAPVGWSVDEAWELSTPYMTQSFNPAVPDDPRVTYWSFSGEATPFCLGPNEGCLHGSLLAGWTLLEAFHQPSDGVVPEASAHWGQFQGRLTADHLTEINQPLGVHRGFDALAFYRTLLGRFRQQGW